jgi:hypothetical protein
MKKEIEYVWVYLYNTQQFKRLRKDDTRLKWNYPGDPPGHVRVTFNRNTSYAAFGNTPQGAANAANWYRLTDIRKLEKQIEELRADMVKVPEGL